MIKISVDGKATEVALCGSGLDILLEGLQVVTSLCNGFEDSVSGGAELFQDILKEALDKKVIANAVEVQNKNRQSTTVKFRPKGSAGNG